LLIWLRAHNIVHIYLTSRVLFVFCCAFFNALLFANTTTNKLGPRDTQGVDLHETCCGAVHDVSLSMVLAKLSQELELSERALTGRTPMRV
jgi:hypothetical protein